MNKVYKITFYVVISIAISYLISLGDGGFFTSFKNSVIALLSTLLAINITASALISAELNKLKLRYPDVNIKEGNVGLKKTFVFQITLLLSLFIVFIIRDVSVKLNFADERYITLFSDAAVVGVFMYYIEAIYDLGCSLYDILQFNSNEEEDQ